jgi:hypothetical protein
MWRLCTISLAQDYYLGIPCFRDCLMSILCRVPMSFVGTFTRVVNSLQILYIKICRNLMSILIIIIVKLGRWIYHLKLRFFFAWYLPRDAILTKNNLAKRNWHGSKKCVFFHHDETMKHPFTRCTFAISIWIVIQITLTLYPPRNAVNICGNWLNGVNPMFKRIIRAGGLAVIWSLWLCKNDKVISCNLWQLAKWGWTSLF